MKIDEPKPNAAQITVSGPVRPRPILRTCTISQLLINQSFLNIMTGFLSSLDLSADIVCWHAKCIFHLTLTLSSLSTVFTPNFKVKRDLIILAPSCCWFWSTLQNKVRSWNAFLLTVEWWKKQKVKGFNLSITVWVFYSVTNKNHSGSKGT